MSNNNKKRNILVNHKAFNIAATLFLCGFILLIWLWPYQKPEAASAVSYQKENQVLSTNKDLVKANKGLVKADFTETLTMQQTEQSTGNSLESSDTASPLGAAYSELPAEASYSDDTSSLSGSAPSSSSSSTQSNTISPTISTGSDSTQSGSTSSSGSSSAGSSTAGSSGSTGTGDTSSSSGSTPSSSPTTGSDSTQSGSIPPTDSGSSFAGGSTAGGSGTETSTDSLVNDVNDVMDETPTSTGSVSQSAKLSFSNLPLLNPSYPPLDEQNKAALFDRLTTAFDQYYQNNFDPLNNVATGDQAFYYFRQELQALIDMYYATKKPNYLETAKGLVLKAISDAQLNPRTFIYQQTNREQWPCFLLKSVISQTGGHSQLNDFQGAAGFMMVARVLKKEKISGWQEISDFVEKKIIEKWLYGNSTLNFVSYTGNQSRHYLLTMLEPSRDKREHFAGICLDLSELGYQKYPYRDWSQFLFGIYLTEKTSLDELWPDVLYRRGPTPDNSKVPTDWGLYHQGNGTLIWSWGGSDLVNYGTLDTSHANRTIWAACQAFEKGMLSKNITLNNLIVSFKKNIWLTANGIFYFCNWIDGNDIAYSVDMGPGRKGNVWFGWHRLAAYDESLKELFVSLGYDLTNGGPNVIGQNKGMKEAPLCLIAWAARLISPNSNPTEFP